MINFNNTPANKQHGAVLIVSLLMLLVTTMLGITAMSTATMEEKMAGNNRQKQLAFQAAESGVRFAEDWLKTTLSDTNDFENKFKSGTSLAELYWDRKPGSASAVQPMTFDIYDTNAWTNGSSISTTLSLNGISTSPRYIIEYLGRAGATKAPVNEDENDARSRVFRIVSVGTGPDNATKNLVQSTFMMPLY